MLIDQMEGKSQLTDEDILIIIWDCMARGGASAPALATAFPRHRPTRVHPLVLGRPAGSCLPPNTARLGPASLVCGLIPRLPPPAWRARRLLAAASRAACAGWRH